LRGGGKKQAAIAGLAKMRAALGGQVYRKARKKAAHQKSDFIPSANRSKTTLPHRRIKGDYVRERKSPKKSIIHNKVKRLGEIP